MELASCCVVGATLVGFVNSLVLVNQTRAVHAPRKSEDEADEETSLIGDPKAVNMRERSMSRNSQIMSESSEVRKAFLIAEIIRDGARSFIKTEYTYMAMAVTMGSVSIFCLLGGLDSETFGKGCVSTLAYILGSSCSGLCGFAGLEIATYANARTAKQAKKGYNAAFKTSFRAGAVMGFTLVSTAVLALFTMVNVAAFLFPNAFVDSDETIGLYQTVTAFGMGGATVSLFSRVGGGIYTKAADVGADLVGKYENGMEEDDPRNPAVIADNVGDNVGDICGMGADLFGSVVSSCLATLLIAARSDDLNKSWSAMCFPFLCYSAGILACTVSSVYANFGINVHDKKSIEAALKNQVTLATVLCVPLIYLVCVHSLPEVFDVKGVTGVKNWHIFLCVCGGLCSGLAIGHLTEYYTSSVHPPVQELAESCKTGAGTNVIYGLALGYQSCVAPTLLVAGSILIGYSFAGEFGVAVGALGILCTLPTELGIDAYGPICDNAGGIAEMSGMNQEICDILDDLDAAGNTTAAIGKGFAIGSAACCGLAMFGAYVTSTGLEAGDISLLDPFVFFGLMVGAMIPYWFTSMTMKSVGQAAMSMVMEVRRQLASTPGILTGETDPDYESCIMISTKESLKAMFAPALMVLLAPLFCGYLFGPRALSGLTTGALVSGVQLAFSQSNTGGAWDNAKKYIEAGNLGPGKGKGSPEHQAAIVGDTVGDPLKDTSGPSLNVLVKLQFMVAVVFAPTFASEGMLVKLVDWIAEVAN